MKTFNLIIAGVGGQGIITLISILDEACLVEGYDVKSSELHGLSQRGGSVLTHVRFGEKVYSPLVREGAADLIIGLEAAEGLRWLSFSNKNTKVLINKYFLPYQSGLPSAEIEKKLKEIAKNNLYLVAASGICKEKLEKEVVSGIYLLSLAANKKLVPIKPRSIMTAMKKLIPKKFLDLNIRAFELAKS
jgi:indolepyruvate ferredoxin oxidoreductase beta subunit